MYKSNVAAIWAQSSCCAGTAKQECLARAHFLALHSSRFCSVFDLCFGLRATSIEASATSVRSTLVAEPQDPGLLGEPFTTSGRMAEPVGTNPKLPTWNGDWKTFSDFKLACYLELDGLKQEDQATLAPRLARNLTGKAWEACLDIDREKLRAEKGLEYLLDFLKQKRGKQQVDVLGEAFEKYFQSPEVIRHDKESLNDYEQRLQVHLRDIQRALTEIGATQKVPTEIYGWFLLNKHIRLEPSDVATLKSQASSYKLEDVMAALRKMWGGESLVHKDQERRRTTAAGRAYYGNEEADDEEDDSAVWWADDEEMTEEDEAAENEVWFEEASEAFLANPSDEAALANFQEAKRAFYKDARKALDQSRVNRGFYPNNKGKAKGTGKGKSGKKQDFNGQCMRCGKWGHKAQHCPQGPRQKGKGKGTGVGFVFSSWCQTTSEAPTAPEEHAFVATSGGMSKAIMDCGASESIVGAWTLQGLHDELNDLGFLPEDEIQLDNTRSGRTLCSATTRAVRHLVMCK